MITFQNNILKIYLYFLMNKEIRTYITFRKFYLRQVSYVPPKQELDKAKHITEERAQYIHTYIFMSIDYLTLTYKI